MGTAQRAVSARAVCTERPVSARDGFHGHRRRAHAWGAWPEQRRGRHVSAV